MTDLPSAFVVPPGAGARVPGPMGGPLEWEARAAGMEVLGPPLAQSHP